MEKEILYRYITATATQAEEKAVLEYIKSDPKHLEELREIQHQYETVLMCAPIINKFHKKENPVSGASNRRTFSRIITAAAIVAVGIFAWISFTPEKKAEEMQPMSYNNIMGKSKLILPDGTVAWLHNNSTLEYGSDFGDKCRKIVLTGDAYFDVAKAEDCPFVLNVDNFNIEALGTSFNVASSSSGIDVSLVEGRVRLMADDSEAKEMTAGHIAHFDRNTRSIDIVDGDTQSASLWAQEKITFHGQSLAEICRILEMWYGRKIELEQSAPLPRLAFTLTDESLESVLTYIKAINPNISYEFKKDGSVRIY